MKLATEYGVIFIQGAKVMTSLTAKQHEVLKAVRGGATIAGIARTLGISRKAVRERRDKGLAAGGIIETPEYKITPPISEDIDTDELVERRKAEFTRRQNYEESRKLIKVKIKIPGPIGILFFGDPHVDDPGCDIAAIEKHTELVNQTQGLFAANVGDATNNWVGRLSRLYAEQETTATQAWQLCEWFVKRCAWLFIVAGNHDAWSGAGDPLIWISRQAKAMYESSSVRIALNFPQNRKVTINCSHDFKGHSQWNPAHGSMKAAQMGFRDHILVNGHRHKSGYGILKDPATGTINHCIQVASYKVYDTYAKKMGLVDQHISPCAVTIIRPDADATGLVQVFFDPELAADYLTFLRKK